MTTHRRHTPGITDCAKCPVGAAARVRDGERCPLTHRPRAAGTYLYVEGAAPERVWFIKRGAVALSRRLGDGSRESVTWAVRRTGQYVGIEAFARLPYADSARLVCDSLLCATDLASFERWMRADARHANSVLSEVVASQWNDTPRRAGADGNAVERAAAWILEECEHPSEVTLSRREIAHLLGMLPETLSRALASLARRGAIEVTRRDVVIRDARLLAECAQHRRDE
jgi:CRP-like cAMP-binding protein